MTSVRLSVIHYSATGTVAALAAAIAGGARDAGAEVRERRVAETAPPPSIEADPVWAAHHASVAGGPVATPDDVVWADAVVLGTPTRFGNPYGTAHVDSTGPVDATALAAARFQGRRVAVIAGALVRGRVAA